MLDLEDEVVAFQLPMGHEFVEGITVVCFQLRVLREFKGCGFMLPQEATHEEDFGRRHVR